MPTVAAVLATVVLAALAVLQAALAGGAPWGRLVWGGGHAGRLPTGLRVGSAVSVVVYALLAAVLLDRAGVVATPLPEGVVRVGAWVLVGYFTLGVLLNAISRSPAERAVMTPVSLVLAVCALLVALAP
ncbi:hypothetical protein [Cellulomonas endophytica]|uniref:hypothetical protein n=1 Tax=Cellulomonas endophytica TaxID=2494735 RepID=UPI0010134BB2|nr:hypothetical protein [Cellulomonas endophytica]